MRYAAVLCVLVAGVGCRVAPPVASTPVPPQLEPGDPWTDPGSGLVWLRVAGTDHLFGKNEVTVDEFRRCVDAGACSAEGLHGVRWKEMPLTATATCNWPREDRGDHPVNCIDWYQADAFCAWAGGRLPGRREWHDAVSGRQKRLYPWGSAPATCELAVMYDENAIAPVKGCGRRGTWAVCSKPAGNSPDGLCDLAGNVWEWSDTRQVKGNADEPRYNLGGSWQNTARHLAHDFELVNPLAFRLDGLGLRCRRAAAP